MDALTVKFEADAMRRRKIIPCLFTQSWIYRSWSPEMKYLYHERIGMICEGDVPTAEAHIIAVNQVLGVHEDY